MIDRLSFADASYMLARTDIGVDWQKANHYQGLPVPEAVQQLLNQSPLQPKAMPTFTPWSVLSHLYDSGFDGTKKARIQARREGIQLKLWWIKHIVTTENTFQERMVLFWHNHFTSSNNKILQPELLWKQNQTIRQHALGSFADLLRAMLKDAALLIYLDGQMNQKGDVNENLARELLELFTLGLGQFNETDVKTVAYALTGWQVDRAQPKAFFDQTRHEQMSASFLGEKGQYSLESVLQRLLSHPHTAITIARKCWFEFISIEEPPVQLLQQWGRHFQRNHYDIKSLLDKVFSSTEFWSLQYRGSLIKSPVDLVLGSLRQFPYPAPSDAEIINMLKNLGQSLFDPPNVKGWAGGTSWVNTETMLIRNAFLRELARQDNDQPLYNRALPKAELIALNHWLLPIEPILDMPANQSVSERVRTLILDPAYQLK